MKTIDEEFGIVRGEIIPYESFNGETNYGHGFFIYDNLLCHKYHRSKEFMDKYPEEINFDYYNQETDEVEEYWWGIRDGDFNNDIQLIKSIKYIPFKLYEYLNF